VESARSADRRSMSLCQGPPAATLGRHKMKTTQRPQRAASCCPMRCSRHETPWTTEMRVVLRSYRRIAG